MWSISFLVCNFGKKKLIVSVLRDDAKLNEELKQSYSNKLGGENAGLNRIKNFRSRDSLKIIPQKHIARQLGQNKWFTQMIP